MFLSKLATISAKQHMRMLFEIAFIQLEPWLEFKLQSVPSIVATKLVMNKLHHHMAGHKITCISINMGYIHYLKVIQKVGIIITWFLARYSLKLATSHC